MFSKPNWQNVNKQDEYQNTFGTYQLSLYLSDAAKRLQLKKKSWLQPNALDIIQKDLQALLWEYVDTENLDIMLSILEFIDDGQKNLNNPFYPYKDYDLRPLQIGIYINQFINQIIEAFQAQDYKKLSINTLARVVDFIEFIKNVKFYKMTEEETAQITKLHNDIEQQLDQADKEIKKIKIDINQEIKQKKIHKSTKKKRKKM
ncbi:hypothetical protein pb186bvf_005680 [Paramecium bursaria]